MSFISGVYTPMTPQPPMGTTGLDHFIKTIWKGQACQANDEVGHVTFQVGWLSHGFCAETWARNCGIGQASGLESFIETSIKNMIDFFRQSHHSLLLYGLTEGQYGANGEIMEQCGFKVIQKFINYRTAHICYVMCFNFSDERAQHAADIK